FLSTKKTLSTGRGESGGLLKVLLLLLQQDLDRLLATIRVNGTNHRLQVGQTSLGVRWGTADEFQVGGAATSTGNGQLVQGLGFVWLMCGFGSSEVTQSHGSK